MKKTILLSPLHYFFGDNLQTGELTAPFHLYKSLIKTNRYAVIGITDTLVNYLPKKDEHIIYRKSASRTHFYRLFEVVTFIIYYSVHAIKVLINHKVDILHHVLPFAIGRTFDPVIMITALFSPKKLICIGPLQVDENIRNIVNKAFFGRLLFFLSIYTLKCADKVIAMNSTTSDYLKQLGIDDTRIIIIPIGIINRKVLGTRDYSRILSEKSIRIIAISTLVHRKGMDLLIRSVGELHKAGYDCHLKIIGSGVEEEKLRSISRELNVEELIQFLGTIPYTNLASQVADSHIFVSMSRLESFGQMYLDAMDLGLPIIASKNIGSCDIIKPEFGVLVDQEDYGALARHIAYYIENPTQLIIMSSAAKTAAKAYSWDGALIDKYCGLVYQ